MKFGQVKFENATKSTLCCKLETIVVVTGMPFNIEHTTLGADITTLRNVKKSLGIPKN